MFFSLLFAVSMILLALAVVCLLLAIFSDPGFIMGAMMSSFFAAFVFIPCGVSWSDHASDLGVISAQHEIILVYQSRVDDLEDRLSRTEYAEPGLANADTPVASIVLSLTEAETELAKAKAERAQAIVRIEKRRAGPMSHVIAFVGDYK